MQDIVLYNNCVFDRLTCKCVNNIDGSLADDRFMEAVMYNCRHTVSARAGFRRPGLAHYISGPARDLLLFSRPARGPPGSCRSLQWTTYTGARVNFKLLTNVCSTDIF